jgi:hypothetical protein
MCGGGYADAEDQEARRWHKGWWRPTALKANLGEAVRAVAQRRGRGGDRRRRRQILAKQRTGSRGTTELMAWIDVNQGRSRGKGRVDGWRRAGGQTRGPCWLGGGREVG